MQPAFVCRPMPRSRVIRGLLAAGVLALLQASSAAAGSLDVVTVPWLGDRSQAHEVYPGGRLVLQGVAVEGGTDVPAAVLTATWDPGDGTDPVPVDASNPLALELWHVYQGTPGQRFTATLTVTDASGAAHADTFPVVVKARTLDVEINMAVDAGLWNLHKQIGRQMDTGVPVGWVPGGYGLPATGSAVLAFAMHHHVATADSAQDPYVHDVNRMLSWLESVLRPIPIGPKSTGQPDGNGNGLGLYGGSPINYTTAHVLTALIASEQPDRLAVLGPPEVRGRAYRDLVQDMVDYAAWGQMDSLQAFPHRGSWAYDHWPGHGDNSIAQWVAGGLIAAERVWGITIPPFVKNENSASVTASWNFNGVVGYIGTQPIWSEGAGTTPSGVTQWTMDGRLSNDPRLAQSLRWIALYHRTRNNYAYNLARAGDAYVLYATARAYRLLRGPDGSPAPATVVDDDPADGVPAWDWFRNDPPVDAPASAGPVGMARGLVGGQDAQGRFTFHSFVSMEALDQPWGLLILASTVFERGPRAACTAEPALTSGPVTFSALGSHHPVNGRAIVDYAWNLGDGTAATGAQVAHTYAVPAGQTTTATATLTVRDDRGNTHTSSCVVTVDTTNTAPVAVDQQYTAEEDTALAGNVLTAAIDADNDPLTASVWSGPTHGTVVLNADGTFTFTPAADFHGADSFIVQVADGRGGTDLATVTIAITPVNDPPVAADISVTLDEDTSGSGNVLTSASDVDGDALTAALAAAPTRGTLVLNADGSFTYTPSANDFGADSFVFAVSDGQGGTTSATVALTILPINDAPTVADMHLALDEDTPGTGNVLAAASDVDGDALTATLVTGPTHGTLALDADGTFTYTPSADYSGGDSFVVHVADGHGGTASATVTLTIAPVNDAPVAPGISLTLDEDTIASGNVLTAASDVDGDPLTAVLVAGPTHGLLALNPDGTFTYTPAGNYHGDDRFSFSADDGRTVSASADVTLIIRPVNDAPVATNNAYSLLDNQSASGNVLTDGAPDTDVDGDALTAALLVGPAHGTTTLAPSGAFSYTPADGFVGTDVFTYVVHDSRGGSAPGTVTLTVLPSNQPPVCSAATPSRTLLWPANHQLVDIAILGVTDAESPGGIAIRIDRILQDEPTASTGDGNTPVDGYGLGTNTARVRAERAASGQANGRVYHIGFTATDDGGLTCQGVVTVGVPVDRGRRAVPVDDGALVDSTVALPAPVRGR